MPGKPPFRFRAFFFSPDGRMSRLPFAGLAITTDIAAITLLMATAHENSSRAVLMHWTWMTLLGLPKFIAATKRLHDVNWPSFMALPLLFPFFTVMLACIINQFSRVLPHALLSIVGHAGMALGWTFIACLFYTLLIDVILIFVPGRHGDNRHGPDPRVGFAAADVF